MTSLSPRMHSMAQRSSLTVPPGGSTRTPCSSPRLEEAFPRCREVGAARGSTRQGRAQRGRQVGASTSREVGAQGRSGGAPRGRSATGGAGDAAVQASATRGGRAGTTARGATVRRCTGRTERAPTTGGLSGVRGDQQRQAPREASRSVRQAHRPGLHVQ